MKMEREKKKTKFVHSTGSPYPATQWPAIASVDQRVILDGLCDLLRPVGQYRQNHVRRSKGKRSKRRKRKDREVEKNNAQSALPIPEIALHITTGFNTTVRSLQDLARHSQKPDNDASCAEENSDRARKVAAVFVCTATLPELLTSSMPTLVAAATVARHQESPIRLVSLPQEAEKRLAEALSQPRVGFVSLLQDAPGGKALIDMVREKLSSVEVPWVNSCAEVKYMPVTVNTTASLLEKVEKTR